MTTTSPTFSVSTSAPTASTIPIASWPMRRGGSPGCISLYGQRSLPQMQARLTATSASVGSIRRASGTFSTRTSPGPYRTVARIAIYLSHSHRVARLLVQLRRGLDDIGFIDLLSPVRGRDFFECDRDGLVSVIQDLHDVLRDCLGESPLLLFGFSWPQLHDDVRHFQRPRYCSSLTCSSHSTTFPSSCS